MGRPVSDVCSSCGHERRFHRIGTGAGVPVGQEYCDDRHSAPCSCVKFEQRLGGVPFTLPDWAGAPVHAAWIAFRGEFNPQTDR